MLLSIIVPVYNVKNYLLKCLESIENQTFQDYEVIVVDDGSTDGGGKLVDEFCVNKEKFHTFHKPNGGLMSAWMEGVQYAKGDYLGFVDSDDYIHPCMFEHMMEYALKYDSDIVMCDRFDVIGDALKMGRSCIRSGLYRDEQMDEIYRKTFPTFDGTHITNARWNKVFKRKLFMNNTKYCEHRSRICEDRFITPSCIFSANSFYYLNEPLYYYVFRAGSNHSKASEKLQDVMELLYRTQTQMLIDKGKYEKYGREADRANLNYLRLMIERNFSRTSDIAVRKKLAYRILNSELYTRCIREYQEDLTGRLGLALKILFMVKSTSLFVSVCSHVGR